MKSLILNINELNINKAAGYDDISCYFIKLSSFMLTPAYTFNIGEFGYDSRYFF